MWLNLLALFLYCLAVGVVVGFGLHALFGSGKRDVLRALLHGARDHWLATLLLIAWSLAVLTAWLDLVLLYRYEGPLPEVGVLPLIRSVVKWGFLQASVPFLAAVFAAWWRSTSPGTVSRLASARSTGAIVGIVSLAALILSLVVIWVLLSIGLGYPPSLAGLTFMPPLMGYALAVVPVGALLGLLGGLVGGRAAMVSRRGRGSRGARSPA